MLRRYTKCEYRHWSTAPWFYTVVFTIVYFEFALSFGGYHSKWNSTALVALPLMIIMAVMIGTVYWTRERVLGGTMSSLTMPVSRKEYITSKYIAVFLGQLFLAGFVVVVTLLTFHSRYLDTYLNVAMAAFIALAIVAIVSGLNFFLAMTGRISAIYLASTASVFIYHIVYYIATERYVRFLIVPSIVIAITAVLITTAVIAITWVLSHRIFIVQNDVR